MLKKIALILSLIILVIGITCFAAEKEIAYNYYFISAQRIDDNILGATTKMVGEDG